MELTEVDVRRALERIDWNFPGATTPPNTVHSFHWFPGNFIPQIPSFIIQLLSDPDDLVVDPFCGSGTTGVEALHLGRRVWLSDVNRASIQVTKGKIVPLIAPEVRRELRSIPERLVWDALLKSEEAGRNGEGSSAELKTWFHADTLAQLRYVWSVVEGVKCCGLGELLEVLFADTLFACASVGGAKTSTGRRRRHHWGWIADNVRPKRPVWHNAIKLFRDRVGHAIEVVEITTPMLDQSRVRIERQDVRTLSIAGAVSDLVVTSPPYLGMIDYTLANRLTYLWMGWPHEEERTAEIGARYRRDKPGVLEEYTSSMRSASVQIEKILRPGGYCALVIGASRKYPQAVGLVLDMFRQTLDVVWGPEGRVPTRRRVGERQGREPVEWLCVFRKPS